MLPYFQINERHVFHRIYLKTCDKTWIICDQFILCEEITLGMIYVLLCEENTFDMIYVVAACIKA